MPGAFSWVFVGFVTCGFNFVVFSLNFVVFVDFVDFIDFSGPKVPKVARSQGARSILIDFCWFFYS